jgi:cation diffusion facilitator CzcD-associated flavoprotein CzcO
MDTGQIEHVDVAILGAGFSGLGMAIRLKQAGRVDFAVLEKADDVGGTWRDNTYPGCACDVPSPLYSFSFAQNPRWSRMFSEQPEILAYLQDTANRFGVRERVRFGWEVAEARWDDAARRWRLTATDGRELTARVVVSGMGGLHIPAWPQIEGLDGFAGAVMHSAGWRDDVTLSGKRVAVIGTGASAIQIVPKIQPEVGLLSLFQRTPAWIMPKGDRALSPLEHALLAHVPGLKSTYRATVFGLNEVRGLAFRNPALMATAKAQALAHLQSQVRDEALRAKLTPDYAVGCKRILLSNDFYRAVQQPNASLITEAITGIAPDAIITADGTRLETDVIILATGFSPMDISRSAAIYGSGGRSLKDEWAADIQKAYLGIVAPGYPNLFFLMGPNTGLGHNSMIYMIETQVDFVLRSLTWLDDTGAKALDIKPDAMDTWTDRVNTGIASSVWASGCRSWYMSADGRNPAIWPELCVDYRQTVSSAPARDWIAIPNQQGHSHP